MDGEMDGPEKVKWQTRLVEGKFPDRAFDIERNAERAGETVRGPEWQQGKDNILAHHMIDRGRDGAVAAADDHHRHPRDHRLADLVGQMGRILDRLPDHELDPRRAQQPTGIAKGGLALARLGVDDQGCATGRLEHPSPTPASPLRVRDIAHP